jgi:hypothetical protein
MNTRFNKGVNNSEWHIHNILLKVRDLHYKYFDFRKHDWKKKNKMKETHLPLRYK